MLQYADTAGTVDQKKSTTCQVDKRQPFSIRYLDKSQVAGNNLLDTLTVGECKLANFSFAAANQSTTSSQQNGSMTGILGINAAVGKTQCNHGVCTDGSVKPTISEAMVSAGCIGSSSYSLFLDDDNSRGPSILFGGVDTAKFMGPLVTLHTMPHADTRLPDRYTKQRLRLAKMTTHLNGTSQQHEPYKPVKGREAALIDTGSKGMILPDHWVEGILNDMKQLSARDNSKYNAYLDKITVACDDISDDSLNFTFTDETGISAQVDVPIRELVMPLHHKYTNTTATLENFGIPNANASNICVVDIAPSSAYNELIVLGDAFFRSSYSYNNFDQNTISIAKPAYNSKPERLLPIGKGPVPRLQGTG